MGNSCIGGHQSYSNVSAHQSPSSSPSSVHSVRSQGTSSSAQTTSAPAEFTRTQAGDRLKTISTLSPFQQERFLNRHDPMRNIKGLSREENSYVYSRINIHNDISSSTLKGYHDPTTAIIRHDHLKPNGQLSPFEADNYNPIIHDPREDLIKEHNYINIAAGKDKKAAKLAESIPVPYNEVSGRKLKLVTVKIKTLDILNLGGRIYRATTPFDSSVKGAHSLVAALPLNKHIPFEYAMKPKRSNE